MLLHYTPMDVGVTKQFSAEISKQILKNTSQDEEMLSRQSQNSEK